MKKLYIFFLLLLALFIISGCNSNSEETSINNEETNIKNEKIEQEEGYPNNNEVIKNTDLNNDEIVDKITLIIEDDYRDKYTLEVNNHSINAYGNNIEPVFNIVDINSNDSYKEIAISEYGSSSDNATTFYYYNGSELKELGKIEGFYGTAYFFGSDVKWDEVKIDGSGTILTRSRGEILHTWFYPDEYKLTDEYQLINIQKDLYEMNAEVEVIKELELFKSKTDSSIGVILKVGEMVTIVASDNKEWCLVKNSNGELGWFAVDNYDVIRGTNLHASEYFIGLCYAD